MLLPVAPNVLLLYIALHALLRSSTPLLYPFSSTNINSEFAVVSDISVNILSFIPSILHFKLVIVDIVEFLDVPEYDLFVWSLNVPDIGI